MISFRKSILVAPYTTLKVGGPARFFCEAENEQEIQEAVKFAREKNLPVFVLGGGSNILVSDKGFDGLVIKISNFKFQISNLRIICDSGCQLSKIVNESVKAGLTGLEWAVGIPGTVGGAVRGNAGAFGSCMADSVNSVKVLEIPNLNTNKSSTFPSRQASCRDSSKSNFELRVTSYELCDCKFSYRDSIFKQNPNLIILSATLNLKKGNKPESEKKVKEILAQRKEKQPLDFPSSGSFFKNPRLRDDFGGQAIARNKNIIKQFEADTGQKVKDGVIPAGYLIERVGLRGKKIGGAMVSQAHANFLVNAGNAKAEDFIILAAVIKTRVRNKFGIQLKEEVEYAGF